MTRPFTCRAIARPFAGLAIGRFYVYGIIPAQNDVFVLSINRKIFPLKGLVA